jgi:hypothetical protein
MASTCCHSSATSARRHRSSVGRPPSPVLPRAFFWRNSNQDAALLGQWKYLNDGTREYLFNLAGDQRDKPTSATKTPSGSTNYEPNLKTGKPPSSPGQCDRDDV